MRGTSADSRAAPCPTTWRGRAFVLGGLGLAALATAASLALGAGAQHIGTLWMAALAWTVVASAAHVLWLGLARRDWSAFGHYELPEDDGDADEWASRTGRYDYLREWEERQLHDDGWLR